MSSEDDLKRLYSIVKKAADTLEANLQQIEQQKQALDAFEKRADKAIAMLGAVPNVIGEKLSKNTTSAIDTAVAQALNQSQLKHAINTAESRVVAFEKRVQDLTTHITDLKSTLVVDSVTKTLGWFALGVLLGGWIIYLVSIASMQRKLDDTKTDVDLAWQATWAIHQYLIPTKKAKR